MVWLNLTYEFISYLMCYSTPLYERPLINKPAPPDANHTDVTHDPEALHALLELLARLMARHHASQTHATAETAPPDALIDKGPHSDGPT